jgi:hypothetical protein
VPVGVKRCNEIIPMTRRAFGKFPGAGEIEQDAVEISELDELRPLSYRRQRFHGAIQIFRRSKEPQLRGRAMMIVKSNSAVRQPNVRASVGPEGAATSVS